MVHQLEREKYNSTRLKTGTRQKNPGLRAAVGDLLKTTNQRRAKCSRKTRARLAKSVASQRLMRLP